MRPVCFHDCAGWLHEPPAGAALGRAAVIAGPHGFEDLCARRTLRMLGDRLAEAGVATLRFDWSGAGDSLGDARDPARLSRWREDLSSAIDLLRAATGAGEIAVIGLRFGALLAAELGTLGRPVSRVALLAPPPSGRGYARELKALSRVMPEAGAEPGFDGLSVAGLRTSGETLEAMRGWCFSEQSAPPAPDILIAAPDGALGARVASRRLEALGARVEACGFPGYEKMMCDPTASEAALDLIGPLVDWARRDAAPAHGAVSEWPFAPRLIGAGFVEEPARFGPAGAYGGVLCLPCGGARGAPVVFLNAGGTHHGGWARVTVDHARALAARGVSSLRIDLPGVGDSRGFEDRTRPAYYAETQVDAALAALDLMEARGFARAKVMGACSGAHHAFHAARLDPRVVGAMMVNLQLFAWTQRSALAFGAWMSSRAFDVDMRKRVEDAETATLSRLQARLAAGAVQLAKSSARTALRALRGAAPPRAEDGEEGTTRFARGALEAMSARCVDVAFVFGEADSGWAEFESRFGARGEWALALPGVSLDVIADTDHPITPPAARARMFDLLEAWATRESPRGAARAFA
jgi:pimeloyl-ACP methyl ester carboxylesterase